MQQSLHLTDGETLTGKKFRCSVCGLGVTWHHIRDRELSDWNHSFTKVGRAAQLDHEPQPYFLVEMGGTEAL